jgi:hypothetical protein
MADQSSLFFGNKSTSFAPTKGRVTVNNLHWAAGFLEGEGSFTCHGGTMRVTAAQNDREPLDKLIAMFGGRIWLKKPSGFSKKSIWTWSLDASPSAQVAMTVYALMSPRRQKQIEEALGMWKAARRIRQPGDLVCIHGHELTPNNIQKRGNGFRCRLCNVIGKRRMREKRLKHAV